jgi:hypothetical protein
MCDKYTKGHKCNTSVCAEEFVGAAPEAKGKVHEKCAMFSTTDWGWKIYNDDLFFPCKMHMSLPLTGGEIARPYAFVRGLVTILEDPCILNVTWFCNETLRHLDGYINKQNFTDSCNQVCE